MKDKTNTPLISNSFDGNLPDTVTNLEELARAVDKMDIPALAGTPTTEETQDLVGAMVSSNTETGIAVTYDDTNGKLNFDAQTAGDARYVLKSGLIKGDGGTLTIASGSITPTHTFHTVDTESAAATDDLDTIVKTNVAVGDVLILTTVNNARDVVLKDNTGNLRIAGDFTLTTTVNTISLCLIATVWAELSRSTN